MKKSLFSFAAIASMLMLGACSSEEPAVEPPDFVNAYPKTPQ